ncbi:MAG: 16S rRNA (cytidine(1402)-2'-O)-methyltransferase [Corynebacterium sp.]|nr:16S rRNA (cytidine(1402)-2'-O)-methyltransferase [Corynebacterium sp.]
MKSGLEYVLPVGITLAATPLGNIGDASARLRVALHTADVIAAEDTRRTRNLAAALGVDITGEVISNFDHNEQARAEMLVERARTQSVLVVTDAGMPVVSDPGYSVVARAREENVPVTCLPGPSAVPTALALSGLHTGRFCFDGFAPRKDGERRRWLEEMVGERRATVFFESPHRLAATLAVAREILGDSRRVAVCRELTKLHEEVYVGPLKEVAEWASGGVRGEIVVVVEGASSSSADVDGGVDMSTLVRIVETRAAGGERRKAAAKAVAADYGVSANQLFAAVVAAVGDE